MWSRSASLSIPTAVTVRPSARASAIVACATRPAGRFARGVPNEVAREAQFVESVVDDVVDAALAVDSAEDGANAEFAEGVQCGFDGARSPAEQIVRDLDAYVGGRDVDGVDDFGEVPLDVDVTEETAREVRVRVDAKPAAAPVCGCGGRAAQHRKVDDGDHGRVGRDVNELVGVEQSSLGVRPAGESLVSDEHAGVEVDD